MKDSVQSVITISYEAKNSNRWKVYLTDHNQRLVQIVFVEATSEELACDQVCDFVGDGSISLNMSLWDENKPIPYLDDLLGRS